jgi:hypothetical protein
MQEEEGIAVGASSNRKIKQNSIFEKTPLEILFEKTVQEIK